MNDIPNTISIFMRIYLENKNDILFNKVIGYNDFLSKDKKTEFYDIINSHFNKIGLYKDYYKDGISFTDFIENIDKQLKIKGLDGIEITIDNVSKEISDKLFIEIDTAKHLLGKRLLSIYIGFAFEYHFKLLFEPYKDFKIIFSKELDTKYKLDFIIEYKGIRLGFQLKTITNMGININTKLEHKQILTYAKCKNKLNGIYYVYHNDNGQFLYLKEIKELFLGVVPIEDNNPIYFLDYKIANKPKINEKYNYYVCENDIDIIKSIIEIFDKYMLT